MGTIESAPNPNHGEKTWRRQKYANETGLTHIELESSWWGKNSIGSWGSSWWVEIGAETEKAIMVKGYSDEKSPRPNHLTDADDSWVPKSKITNTIEPHYDTADPEGEPKGTITLKPAHRTRYGPKMEIVGDTYEAFKKDDVADDLPWEETHATWNGDAWEIDANEDAIEKLEQAATDKGYTVQKPK